MKRIVIPAVLIPAALMLLASCGDDTPRPGARLDGVWGAEHIELDATGDIARIEFDCAYDLIDGEPVLGSDLRFDWTGTHTLEGGPVRQDSPPLSRPARFQGRVIAGMLLLTVTLTDTGETLGPYQLFKGTAGDLYKCL